MVEIPVKPDNGKDEKTSRKGFLVGWFPWLIGLGLVGILSVIGAIVLFILFCIFLAIMI